MKQHRLKTIAAAALMAVGLIGVSACSQPLPTPPEQSAAPENLPVLDKPRIERILDQVDEVVAKADKKQDSSLLKSRMGEPALGVRKAEYRLAKATKDSKAPFTPRTLEASSQVEIVSTTDTWPRTVMVVTKIPDGENVPLLITLQQENPQAQYTLDHWVRLLPGTKMPPTAVAASGTEQVGKNVSQYKASPKQALTRYADLLTNGKKSKYSDDFAADEFAKLIAQEAKSLDTVDEAGTFSHKSRLSDSPILALETQDGGYIAVGELTSKQKFTKTISGSEITVSNPHVDALDSEGGKLEYLDDSLIARFHTMVAVYVPAKSDKKAKVTVLGAERVLTDVERKCPRDTSRCS